MNHTTNYNLPQWEASDAVKREDMNTAMSAIDAAIAGGARIACGTYVGTGNYGSSWPNSLTFDFEPKLLVIQTTPIATLEPHTDTREQVSLVIVRGVTQFRNVAFNELAYFTWSGKTVSWYSPNGTHTQFNGNWQTYAYCAIG